MSTGVELKDLSAQGTTVSARRLRKRRRKERRLRSSLYAVTKRRRKRRQQSPSPMTNGHNGHIDEGSTKQPKPKLVTRDPRRL